MTTSIKRVRTVEDCTLIRHLVQAHIEYERSDTVLPPEWATATTGLISAGKVIVLVAQVKGHPVGYASITFDVATWEGAAFAHLECLYVADDHRGAGIGRQLLEAAATKASRHGHRQMQWQTPAWNTDAIRFYERTSATYQTKQRFTLPLPVQ